MLRCCWRFWDFKLKSGNLNLVEKLHLTVTSFLQSFNWNSTLLSSLLLYTWNYEATVLRHFYQYIWYLGKLTYHILKWRYFAFCLQLFNRIYMNLAVRGLQNWKKKIWKQFSIFFEVVPIIECCWSCQWRVSSQWKCSQQWMSSPGSPWWSSGPQSSSSRP